MRELPAEIIIEVINYKPEDLSKLLEESSEEKYKFNEISFEGINENGEFVFEVFYESNDIPFYRCDNVYVIFKNNTLFAEF